ncbi:DsbA family protein [Phycicoccus elongatus]|uniref:DsbA family protein n=1 Tax=Phycicoccus elongatus TaxID=101689 RepID=UPI0012EC1DEE|nr:hypothetical protein [Phycicoccus elongatus]
MTLLALQADTFSAEASGARGTPTFFVGTQRHTGPHDAATLIAALEDHGGR